jgi:16S rRNA (adenine1518-N6/adenine1519-N6)-dimethyltransferase
LTHFLIQKAAFVWAIEIDRDLVKELREKFKNTKNLEIIEGDALHFDFETLARGSSNHIMAIGNLPYNISTKLIFRLLPLNQVFSDFSFMLQKEVAQRLTSGPGTKDYGAASLLTKLYCDAEILMRLGPEAFRPAPKVESAFVHFNLLKKPRVSESQIDVFKNVVKAAFHYRRKTLANSFLKDGRLNLAAEVFANAYKSSGIEPTRRAESISFEEFTRLTESISVAFF